MKSPLVIDLCEQDLRACVPRAAAKEVSRRDFTARHAPQTYSAPPLDASTRRALLEVFKFLSVTCLETAVALTTKTWLHVSRDEDLWKSKYILEFKPTETAPRACYRAGFIDSQLGSCWHCRQYINHFGIECEPLGRLLCMTCARLETCKIVSVKNAYRKFGVERSTLEALRVPVFQYDYTPSTYAALIGRKLVPYYSRRRDLLTQRLSGALGKALLKKLHQVDFSKVFEGCSSLTKLTAPLLEFCGRNEKTEDLAQSLVEFVARVKAQSSL